MGTVKRAELHIVSETVSSIIAVPGSTVQVAKLTLDLAVSLGV